MKQWTDLVQHVLDNGDARLDRTGTGTLSVFGGHMKFDLRERFPLVQAKETKWRVAFLEMLWFLRGERTTKWLNENGSKLWDAWADEYGRLGRIYGSQWRNWNNEGIDQIAAVIRGIKTNPYGRRHIVSAWQVSDLPYMALPPCHWAHQLYVAPGGYLDMQVNQRSWDLALGAPFNIAQYALLLHLYARATHRRPRFLHFSYGDAHVYMNHVEPLKEMLNRRWTEDGARLAIYGDNIDIDGYHPDDFEVVGYKPEPFIKLDVAV